MCRGGKPLVSLWVVFVKMNFKMNFSVKLFCEKKIVKLKWLNVNKFVERFPEKIRKTEEAKLFTNFSVKYFLQKKIVKLKWIFFHDFFWLKMFPEKKFVKV